MATRPRPDDGGCVKLSLADLVRSVLPWPFHKGLPDKYCGQRADDTFWDRLRLAIRRPPRDVSRK